MRRPLFALSLAVVLALASLTVVFASGVALTGIGARATALGGAYRGLANDWSGMYWNPAGLTQIKGLHFGGSFEIVAPKGKYLASPAIGALRDAEVENEPQTFYLPAAGFVYGMDKLAVGISVFAPFGLGSKWNLLETGTYNPLYPDIDVEDDLKVIDIHPSIAYQVTDKLSVGLGVSIVSNQIEIRQPVFTPNPLKLTPLNPLLTQLGLLARPFDHLLTEQKLVGDGWGFGANLGLQYKVTECLTVGVAGRYYLDQGLEGTVSMLTYTAKPTPQQFNALKAQLDALLAGGQIDQASYAKALGVYSGATINPQTQQPATAPVEVDVTADLPLPMEVGFGVAYTGIQNLLVAADVAFTQWSAWDIIKIKKADGTDLGELTEEWKDAIRASLGLEYSLQAFKVRGFFYTEPGVPPDHTLNPTIPDINRRYVAGIGVGYQLPFGMVHASVEKMFIGDRTVSTWAEVKDATGMVTSYDNMAGTYKLDALNFMVGVDIKL
ncbi:MAG: outer membrane protein transport protein [candidate division KSB1 bacterium]|nr:outer membrane protein transport protein [candidate division KSB1 bacterium]MDZ7392925.1 outer membrane protein transport protein [candidate division KSB1 bacterium]